MLCRFRPVILIYVLIAILEILIGYSVYRETTKIEDVTLSIREGHLNEISHAVASAVEVIARDGNLELVDFNKTFKSFEELDPRGHYPVDAREHAALRLAITDPHGRVIYDSLRQWVGSDLTTHTEVRQTLAGQYGRSEWRDSEGYRWMAVAAPVWFEGRIIGTVVALRSDFVRMPEVRRFQETTILVGMAAGVSFLLLVLALFLHFLKPIELWFAYTRLFKNLQYPARPNLRRTRIGRLGAAIDHIFDSLSYRSYVEDLMQCLSHEMKNPLAVIRASAEFMALEADRSKDRATLEDIINHTERMVQLIDRVITIAALEKRDSLKELKSYNLRLMLETVIKEFRARAEPRQITLDLDVPDDLIVYCDALLLIAAVNNLIQNALEYSTENSTVEVSAREDKRMVQIQVRDHGCGIPEHALARIFEKYYSLPKMTTQLKSSGLGLTFVQEIADLHWGCVTLENHPEGGVLAVLKVRNWWE